ncbi:maltokinase N-terminal cap-like domain-containing protein [Streptomyces sp. MS06]|uniref:maltokinase N-terminal cap-like domain-containing protein n=1 Tax=Streptomyces sp. MS06 TaxID=3385974 RepID=UPI0039A119DA
MTVPLREQPRTVLTGPVGGDLPHQLTAAALPWLTARRWFAHDRGPVHRALPRLTTVLTAGDPALVHLLVDVRHAPAGPDHRYQLLLGVRDRLPDHLAAAAVGRVHQGPWKGRHLYEAVADTALTRHLLLSPLFSPEPGTDPRHAPRTSRVMAVEQSNTNVVYGDRLLLKLLRSPLPGPHPEADTLAALTAAGCAHTPALAGRLQARVPGEEPSVLGILQDYLDADADGWQLATRQAAACIDGTCRGVPPFGGFTAQARRLGAAVAGLHRALATAFPPTRLTAAAATERAEEMTAELTAAAEHVPQLDRFTGRLAALHADFARQAARTRGLAAQRGHGDLHLGQTLHTEDGWKVIDFEGEPDRPLGDRLRPHPVTRDLAGMLRSFDYAAQHALAGLLGEPSGPADAPGRLRRTRRARAWAIRNRRAFCAGYADAGGPDPRCQPLQLRVYEAEKAVYEAVYEARHRPGWLPIPLAALHRLATPGRVH